MKQQELIDLLESWGFNHVSYGELVLRDKLAQHRVIITEIYVDIVVSIHYLGKEYHDYYRLPVDALELIAREDILMISKNCLMGAMRKLFNDYVSKSFLRELS